MATDRVSEFVGKDLIYRPEFARMLGSVTAAILLKQVAFWASIKRGEAFYKFNAPCQHKLYIEGDSWEEELGFSRSELDGARNKVGTKITQGSDLFKEDVLSVQVANFDDKGVMVNANCLVVYWTDANRVTHYLFNRPLLEDALNKFAKMEEERKAKLMRKTCNSKCGKPALPGNAGKSHYLLTEITSEITTDIPQQDESNDDSPIEPPAELAEPQQAALISFPVGSAVGRPKKQKDNDSLQGKAKRTGSPRAPNPNTLPIMDAYVQALGYSPANYAKESGFAKRLAAMGYTPEQVAATYQRMKAQPFWQDKFLSLCKVAEQIGEDFPPARKASGEPSAAGGYRFLNDDNMFL